MSEPAVTLAPFEPARDLDMVARWLELPHVSRWWGPAGTTLAEVRAHDPRDAALICAGGRAVGLLCWQVPSAEELAEAGLSDLPPGHVDIDIMIGAPEALGRGIGPAALRLLVERLRQRGVRHVGLAGAEANTRAQRACLRAGFTPWRAFREGGEGYLYLTRQTPPQAPAP